MDRTKQLDRLAELAKEARAIAAELGCTVDITGSAGGGHVCLHNAPWAGVAEWRDDNAEKYGGGPFRSGDFRHDGVHFIAFAPPVGAAPVAEPMAEF